jgi:hypothetical protein
MTEDIALCYLCSEPHPCTNIGCDVVRKFKDITYRVSLLDDNDMYYEVCGLLNLLLEFDKELDTKYFSQSLG